MARADILDRVERQFAKCNALSWMINVKGLDPCRQVEQLCASGPRVTLGNVSSSLSCPYGNNAQGCCCSAATYALLSACWVCQGHNPIDINIGIEPSYIDFFHDSGCFISNFSDLQPQPKGSDIPSWALILPNSLSDHWNFTEARISGLAMPQHLGGSQPTVSSSNSQVVILPSSSSSTVPASSSLPPSSKSSTSPGIVAAAAVCSLAVTSLIFILAWFVRRCRRRRVNQLNRGVKVDLTEPEMDEPSRVTDIASGTIDPLRRAVTFPFPYEGIVARYHPNAPHSLEPSSADARTLPDSDRDSRTSRRHTAPVPSARFPMDQFDRDLARLQGVDVSPTSQVDESHQGEGKSQIHHPYIHKIPTKRAASIATFTPSSNSGSTNSRRARRKSSGEGAARGRYFHLPPSAQYLANVARYPEKVDPDRPWDIRQEGGTSRNEND